MASLCFLQNFAVEGNNRLCQVMAWSISSLSPVSSAPCNRNNLAQPIRRRMRRRGARSRRRRTRRRKRRKRIGRKRRRRMRSRRTRQRRRSRRQRRRRRRRGGGSSSSSSSSSSNAGGGNSSNFKWHKQLWDSFGVMMMNFLEHRCTLHAKRNYATLTSSRPSQQNVPVVLVDVWFSFMPMPDCISYSKLETSCKDVVGKWTTWSPIKEHLSGHCFTCDEDSKHATTT